MEQERRTPRSRLGKILDDVVDVAHPEMRASTPGATLRRILVGAMVVAVGGIAAFGWEWMTAESRARHEAQIADEIEAEAAADNRSGTTQAATNTSDDESNAPSDEPPQEPAPFDPELWSYTEVSAPKKPGPGILLMDSLNDETVQNFQQATYTGNDADELLDWLWDNGTPVDGPMDWEDGSVASRWNVTLNSTSSTAFTITDLQLADLDCGPARATALFDLTPQGGDDRMVISFSMDDPTVGKLYEWENWDHAPNWGEPFFDHKVINLGGPEEGVGFLIEVVTTDQDCTWSAFEVTYHGPEGGGTFDITSDDGDPFEARGIADDADTFTVLPSDYDNGTDVEAVPPR